MNKKALRKMAWFRVRLRPMAVRWDESGRPLPALDDPWQVRDGEGAALRIHNLRTGHFLDLWPDGVHDFRATCFDVGCEPGRQGIVKLLGYVWLQSDHAGFEPLSLPTTELLQLQQALLS
ncbi:MAG: hypothetical protein ACREFX_07505 [Opitutaceae bacterium]